jgi:GMP synthase-like glutamine amidotransferase
MVLLTVELDNQSAERLHRRAQELGVTSEELAAQEVTRAVQDPFEFVGFGESDASAVDADDLLAKGFGIR